MIGTYVFDSVIGCIPLSSTRAYTLSQVYADSGVTCTFALTICLTMDRFPEVQAIAHSSRVEDQRRKFALRRVFRLVGATFPLLGERSGAITCLGDNRSTDSSFK